MNPKQWPAPILILAAAIFLTLFFHFYQLHQIPPGFTFDEASHALDALDILNGQLFLISPRLEQAAAGYMYLLAVVFKLFGAAPLAQRILTATWAVVLTPVAFLAVYTLFKSEMGGAKAAWLAAFTALLIASSFWGTLAGRIGYEYLLPPVLALLAIFLFWQTYPRPGWPWLLAAALAAVLGFYMYVGSAPFLLVIPIAIGGYKMFGLSWPWRGSTAAVNPTPPTDSISWPRLFFFTLLVGILAGPLYLALTAGADPEVNRTLEKLIFNDATSYSEAIAFLVNSLVAHARPFLALGGDLRWLSNLPDRPILNPILAVSFVAGFIIALKRFKRLPYLFVLVYWGVALIPSVLTLTDSPFYFRMSSLLPPTYMIIALAWVELYGWLTEFLRRRYPAKPGLSGVALAPFLLVGLVWLPLETYRDYFLNWAKQPQVAAIHDGAMFKLMGRMAAETDLQAIFILPRNTEKFRPDYTLDFLYRQPTVPPLAAPLTLNHQFFYGQAPFIYAVVDEPDLRQTLTQELASYQTIYLIEEINAGREYKYHKAYADKTLPFLFEKYGSLQSQEKTHDYEISVYRLDAARTNFEAHLQTRLPADFQPLSQPITPQIKLIGLKPNLQPDSLTVDLAWQTLDWVDQDYTIFVKLLDETGRQLAGADELPERGFSTLDQQETILTHHRLSLENVTPGAYTLLTGLYYFDQGAPITVGSIEQPLALPGK